MIKRTFTLINDRGLHVRPCMALAETANRFECEITMVHHGDGFRAKSSMFLIGAFAQQGDEITLVCDGADDQEAMAALEALITSGFEEVMTNE